MSFISELAETFSEMAATTDNVSSHVVLRNLVGRLLIADQEVHVLDRVIVGLDQQLEEMITRNKMAFVHALHMRLTTIIGIKAAYNEYCKEKIQSIINLCCVDTIQLPVPRRVVASYLFGSGYIENNEIWHSNDTAGDFGEESATEE